MVGSRNFTERIEAGSFISVVVFKTEFIVALFISFLDLTFDQSMVVPVFGRVKDILECHDMFVIDENNIIGLLDRVS